MSSIKGKTAVVTGATSGIGKSIAIELAEQGVKLCLIGRDKKKLNDTRSDITESQSDIQLYNCDLCSTEDIGKVANEILDNNKIDIIVHSAGIFYQQSLESTSVDKFDEQYFINVRAPLIISKLLLPSIKSQKGEIIFINSSVALHAAKSNLSGYTASKYALKALADSLRNEVNQFGVRVLSVYPGRTATAMQEQIYKLENKEYKGDLLLQPKSIADSVIGSLLLPRTAEITDILIRPGFKS